MSQQQQRVTAQNPPDTLGNVTALATTSGAQQIGKSKHGKIQAFMQKGCREGSDKTRNWVSVSGVSAQHLLCSKIPVVSYCLLCPYPQTGPQDHFSPPCPELCGFHTCPNLFRRAATWVYNQRFPLRLVPHGWQNRASLVGVLWNTALLCFSLVKLNFIISLFGWKKSVFMS